MWKQYKSKAHLAFRYIYFLLICGIFLLLVQGVGGDLRLLQLSPVPPLTPAGVVIETLAPGAALARAGLRVGDVLDSWERGPAERPVSRGALRNAFDWLWLLSEQAPRGGLRLAGQRAGRPLRVSVPAGTWSAEVRPRLTPSALALYHQGRTLIAEGKRRHGIARWRRIAAHARSTDRNLSSWMLLRIAQAWVQGQRWPEAKLALHQALTEAHQPRIRVALLETMAEAHRRAGDLAPAERTWRQVQQIQQRVWSVSPGLARTNMALGTLAWHRGNLDRAENHWRHALYLQESLAPHCPTTAETWGKLGRLTRRRGDLELALRCFGQALDALAATEDASDGVVERSSRHRAWHHDLYREMLEVLVRLGRSEEAFNVLERSRARDFLAMLAGRPRTQAEIPSDLTRARRSLATRYDHVQQMLAALVSRQDAAARRTMLLESQQRLLQERQGLDAQIRAAIPASAEHTALPPLTLAAARQALDPGTVMLSYSVGRERSQLFMVSRQHGLRVATLPVGAEALRDEITVFRQRLREPSRRLRRGPRRLATALYGVLVAPAADLIAAHDRILFIPDGPLHLLPFGALGHDIGCDGGGCEDEADGWQYLAEWKPFHLALSATVYKALKDNRPMRDRAPTAAPFSIAAFADPDLPIRSSSASSAVAGDTHLRSTAEKGSPGARLPYSRSEVEQILHLFPNSAVAFVGAEATEERVKALAADSRILHFATHGMIDGRVPLDSALALAVPRPDNTGGENGLLQAWEIHERLQLDADLVVLSACSSGLGAERRGEGLIGLTRAFHYAGARSVAASLWNINDRSTAELMVRFYRHLKSGKPKDEALRAAQIELIRAPIPSRGVDGRPIELDARSPYHWAAFQIFGDWQ